MVMQSFIKNCRLNQLAFWSRLVFKIQYVTGVQPFRSYCKNR